ncbi:MAG: FAD-dependent monooxygenase [Actinomycetota bacterium]|nr:FAD-dependent monooxygenase [Actinomycetota bacterium]
MARINTALVVGAGTAGTAAAMLLARRGVATDLIELRDDVGALGSGITVQGNALRVLRQLGVYEEAARHGYAFTTLGFRAADGTLLAEIDDVRTGGPDLPATVGMERPRLASLLVDAAVDSGVKLRFGTTVDELTPRGDAVDVRMSDGQTATYDLVVGADGVRSHVRDLLGIELTTEPVGMGIWRVFTGRPPSITRTDLCYDGPEHIAGFCPTGDDSLYAYLVEDACDRSGLSAEQGLEIMRAKAAAYGGPWDEIRARMVDPDRVHHTHFEHHLLPRPWHRGRIVLIGDAVHVSPPTLAQGAAQALEDAVALDDELANHDDPDAALDAFGARRFGRAKLVGETSVALCRLMQAGDPDRQIPAVIGRTLGALCEPA